MYTDLGFGYFDVAKAMIILVMRRKRKVEYLSERVIVLQKLTNKICKKKIENFV
jgi:hypothetical protein